MGGPAAEAAFWNLVTAACADRGIRPAEQAVLDAYARKLALPPPQAVEIQAFAQAETPPRLRIPKTLWERIDTLRAILEVVAADGRVSPGELSAIRAFASRLSIPPADLDSLVATALKRSPKKLDRAFANLTTSCADSPERVELLRPSAGPRRKEMLRSMPFAARMASAIRDCRRCGLAFASGEAYERLCRSCRVDAAAKGLTGGRCETLVMLLFVLFFLPAALLVEGGTGLWGWGAKGARKEERERRDASYRSRHRGLSFYLLPAAALTVLLSGIAAVALGTIFLTVVRRFEEADLERQKSE